MTPTPHPILILLFASGLAALGAPGVRAQTTLTAEAKRAEAATPTPLDLRSSTAEAMRAAHAAQSGTPLRALAAPPVAADAPSDTVESVTVSPAAERQGVVVASTSARPLASPNYGAQDAADRPMAISVGPNQALGLTSFDTTVAAGFRKPIADLDDSATRTDLGVSGQF